MGIKEKILLKTSQCGGVREKLMNKYVKKFFIKLERDLKMNIGTNENCKDHDYCDQCKECRKHRDNILAILKQRLKIK